MNLASIPYRRRSSVFCECFVVLGESFFFFFTLFSALLTYDWRKPHVSTARRHQARVRRPPPSGSPGRPAPRSYRFLLFPFLFFFSFFWGGGESASRPRSQRTPALGVALFGMAALPRVGSPTTHPNGARRPVSPRFSQHPGPGDPRLALHLSESDGFRSHPETGPRGICRPMWSAFRRWRQWRNVLLCLHRVFCPSVHRWALQASSYLCRCGHAARARGRSRGVKTPVSLPSGGCPGVGLLGPRSRFHFFEEPHTFPRRLHNVRSHRCPRPPFLPMPRPPV